MGSCVSSMHKKTPDKLKMSSFDSKNHDLIIPPSPIKEKPSSGFPPINDWPAIIGRDLGSKEETFFDSRAWLDSDCEDDFYSVKGDSCGNTPVHQAFSTGTPQVNKTLSEDRNHSSMSEASPTGKKMKLGELFKQSIREAPEDPPVDEQKTAVPQIMVNGDMDVHPTVLTLAAKSTDGTRYLSGVNSFRGSESTANDDPTMEEKRMRTAECCLPSLISRHNFSDRKKKMSPAIVVNG
ncbi:uncharacterized protein At3g27210-like [Mangifera indica]|uniref:uncharacterized protein At3g27210-like n=1 Tax=Mangifera indica TaxID=29780 RepID=UPI001CFC4362|nr:uncharacterized protein At3g27210-like [Mangifera indica]